MQKRYADLIRQSVPKIVGVGVNYEKSIEEIKKIMPFPQDPILFLKAWSSLKPSPHELSLPLAAHHAINHEIELGVIISKGGRNIAKEKSMEHVGGYFLLLDFTDMDLLKVKGLPWCLGKSQDNFCPVSEFISPSIDPYKVELELKVNGKIRQKEMTSQLHFKIDDIISYASKFMTLQEGDLILTGTPPGVDKVAIGDEVSARANYEGKLLASLNFKVTS